MQLILYKNTTYSTKTRICDRGQQRTRTRTWNKPAANCLDRRSRSNKYKEESLRCWLLLCSLPLTYSLQATATRLGSTLFSRFDSFFHAPKDHFIPADGLGQSQLLNGPQLGRNTESVSAVRSNAIVWIIREDRTFRWTGSLVNFKNNYFYVYLFLNSANRMCFSSFIWSF